MSRSTGKAFVVAGLIAATAGAAFIFGRDTGGGSAGPLVPSGAGMVDVRVPDTLSAQAQLGKERFDAQCAQCHGLHAAGQDGVAPPLVHKIYEPSHHGDMAFTMAVKRGVRAHHWRFGNMPPVDGLTDADIARVTLYIRELQRENGIH